MAREQFYLLACKLPDGCFSSFDEAANRDAISSGVSNPYDPYSWVEASFEVRLIRAGEATHVCSLTPSSYYVTIRHVFVGFPNAAWEAGGDPHGLEASTGSDDHGYMSFVDSPDPRFVVNRFTVDTVRAFDMRKPRRGSEDGEAYHSALWDYATSAAFEINANGGLDDAPILRTYNFRKWELERRESKRARSCAESKRARMSWPVDLLAPAEEARARAEWPHLFGSI